MSNKLNVILICFIFEFIIADINQKPKRQYQGVCDSACQQAIDNVQQYAGDLNLEQTANHDNLLKRVIDLEKDFYEAVNRINILLDQISNLEFYLSGNVTTLNQKITDEFRSAIDFTTIEIGYVKGDFNTRLNNLTAIVNSIKNNPGSTQPPPVNSGGATEVYYNLTRRIDGLEYGKISNLTADNNIWRRNFRVVNATFEKMKYNNNCLCK